MMQNMAAAVVALNPQATCTFLRLKRQLDGRLNRDCPNVPIFPRDHDNTIGFAQRVKNIAIPV